MAEINYTWLRQAMLTAVKAGRVSLTAGRWTFRCGPSTTSQMSRSVKSLQFARCVEVAADGRCSATQVGDGLLAEWDAKYGPVT